MVQIAPTIQSRVLLVSPAFHQDEFLLPHLRTHLVPWMRLLLGFFALFPNFKKSARLGPHSGSGLPAETSPSTRGACAVPTVHEDESEPETESESEVEEDSDLWVDEALR